MSVRVVIVSEAPATSTPRAPEPRSTTSKADTGGAGPRGACPFCPPPLPPVLATTSAVLIACVLAEFANPLGLPDMTFDRAESLLGRALHGVYPDNATVLRWRTSCH